VPPSAPSRPLAASAGEPGPCPSAAAHPVARVAVDVSLPHLDRPFDYRVSAEQDPHARPGTRVRVRFAGRLVNGYVLERAATTEHQGSLARIERVVSPEPVLTPEIARLCRRVADHYAGTMADVLRLAVPTRHARSESAPLDAAGVTTPQVAPAATPVAMPVGPGGWTRYEDGAGFVRALAAGGRPRAVTCILPDDDWPDLLARAAACTASGGRGAMLIAPDTKDVARLDQALTSLIGPGDHVTLHSEQRPSLRYRAFLRVLRGQTRIVVGTRSAVFAPVADLGLVAVWDDGDDLLAEPRAPYPHARDVALLRAHQQGTGLLLAGIARTAEAHRLLQAGWARELRAARAVLRTAAAAVRVSGDVARADATARARLPGPAFAAARDGLRRGPVLVQVPRGGYRPVLACQACRAPAQCPQCGGPMGQHAAGQSAACSWCGQAASSWHCPHCGSPRLRAVTVGRERTAEEVGRAFPGVPVRQSGLGHILTSVPPSPAMVVATPGAEPIVEDGSGYAAAVLLDAAVLLHRPDLRSAEEALRRWLTAAALVRPAAAGGIVVLVGEPSHRAVQALVRWDPAGFAARELAERESARLPPAWRLAELTGPAQAVADAVELVQQQGLPSSAEVLGPVGTAGQQVRAMVRASLSDGPALTATLQAAAAVRAARRRGDAVRVRVDPVDIG